jgi:hypothetical protein
MKRSNSKMFKKGTIKFSNASSSNDSQLVGNPITESQDQNQEEIVMIKKQTP